MRLVTALPRRSGAAGRRADVFVAPFDTDGQPLEGRIAMEKALSNEENTGCDILAYTAHDICLYLLIDHMSISILRVNRVWN